MEEVYDKLVNVVFRNNYTLMIFVVLLTTLIFMFFMYNSIYGKEKGSVASIFKALGVSLLASGGLVYLSGNVSPIPQDCEYDGLKI